MRQPHGRDHVQPVHLFLAADVGFEKESVRAEAGVVDQQAEARFVADAIGDAIEIGVGGQIGSHEIGGNAIGFRHFGGERAQPILAPRDQQQIVASWPRAFVRTPRRYRWMLR